MTTPHLHVGLQIADEKKRECVLDAYGALQLGAVEMCARGGSGRHSARPNVAPRYIHPVGGQPL
jgi:hypothetical protein